MPLWKCVAWRSALLSSPVKPWGVYPLGVYSSTFLPKEMPRGKLRCAALRVGACWARSPTSPGSTGPREKGGWGEF